MAQFIRGKQAGVNRDLSAGFSAGDISVLEVCASIWESVLFSFCLFSMDVWIAFDLSFLEVALLIHAL